jgi:pimeloyl-ACP methyl ester carboxylesterase
MDNLLKHRLYFISNEKDWIIFIHGIGGNSRTFSLQLKAFKNHFNILMPDLRGHGLSKNMPGPESGKYSLDFISKDILRLMDYHKIEKANFIGCSFGASLIRILEFENPHRFKSIILTGAVLKIKTSFYLLLKLGRYLSPYVNNHFLYILVAYFIMPYRNHRKSRQLFIKTSKDISRREYALWLAILEEVKHRIDRLFNVPFLSDSVLLISGNEDHAFLEDCICYCSANQFVKIEVLKNCGHLSSIEKYEEFNNIALNFLQKEETKNAEK